MQGFRAPRGSGEIDIDNRRVLVRADLCSPQATTVESQRLLVERLAAALQPLVAREARIVVAGHLESPHASLDDIGVLLAEALACEIRLPDEVLGDGVTKLVNDTRAGEVLLLENLAQESGEAGNNPDFARLLAAMADAYINDAPYASRLGWASTTLVPLRVGQVLRAAGDNFRPLLTSAAALPNRSGSLVLVVQIAATQDAFASVSALAPLLRPRDEVHVIGPGASVLAQVIARPDHPAILRSLAQECKTLHAKVSAREALLIVPTDIEWMPERQPHLRVTLGSREDVPADHRYVDVSQAGHSRLQEGLTRAGQAIYLDFMDVDDTLANRGAWVLDHLPAAGGKIVAGMPALLALAHRKKNLTLATCNDPHLVVQVLAGIPLPAVQALTRDA